MALLQLLARLIRITTLPRELDMYFAPILKTYASRLEGDKTALSHSQGLADISLYECAMAWETRETGEEQGGHTQPLAAGQSEASAFVGHDVGAAIRPLRKGRPITSQDSGGELTCYDAESVSVKWEATTGLDGAGDAKGRYMAITRMGHYSGYSFEEIRVGDYLDQLARLEKCVEHVTKVDATKAADIVPAGKVQSLECLSKGRVVLI